MTKTKKIAAAGLTALIATSTGVFACVDCECTGPACLTPTRAALVIPWDGEPLSPGPTKPEGPPTMTIASPIVCITSPCPQQS